MPHFIDIIDIEPEELHNILDLARKIKETLAKGESWQPLAGKHLAMIFEKPSTRTRTSFEVGINQLGGHAIIIHAENSQLGRGETVADTAATLSGYVDIIMARCFKHSMIEELAHHASIPVINGLTNSSHPCQVMADILTFIEHRGSIEDKNITWLGDGNNMTTSWIHAAKQLNFNLKIATPPSLKPSDDLLNLTDRVTWTEDPLQATKNSDLITTDTWVSMGDENAQERKDLLADYQVNADIMKLGQKDALFMHCLPAHRGEEVTNDVIDGKQSVVWDEAENRLHIQKAIILWCLKQL